MWTNPKHARTPEPLRTAPKPSGQALATFPRPGRGRGPDTELRATLEEYAGHPYISLRVWSRGADGHWYPSRKGCSVRVSEAEDLANALEEAAFRVRFAGNPKRPDGDRSASDRRRPAPTPARGERTPVIYDPDFDEVGGAGG